MSDYKDTLNLPKTDFSMKANLPHREPEQLKRWEAMNLYARMQDQAKDRPPFILHDGPPYANGRIHMGTALNKILKDIVCKSKRMSGYFVPYVPGWDCHGLPIELNVEKKVGKPGHKCTPDAFRKACRDYAAKQVDIQKADFQRLGVMGDWSSPYLTMDFSYEAKALRVLSQLVRNGYLTRGQKPVHWCAACGSALAEAEVEYADKASPAIDVAFDTPDPVAILDAFEFVSDVKARVSFPIWTTTPWTLPANQAVALNPDTLYGLVQTRGSVIPRRYYVVAVDLVDAAMKRYGVDDYAVVCEIEGKALDQFPVEHPFIDRLVPIVMGEHVTTEAGTGVVHTAPAHGVDDYRVGSRYKLPLENPVDSRSRFVEDTPLVGGLPVFDANEVIIDVLRERGKLLHAQEIKHSYPHCWRHKTPLIFRATPQWFISMQHNNLREHALEEIENTEWIPAWGQRRIIGMVAGRPDWCVSRQRTWGVPLAILIHKDTQDPHPQMSAILDKIAAAVEEGGVEAWYQSTVDTWLDEDVDQYEKVTDVLEVWFESGISHAAVLEMRDSLGVPADLYLEGSDQHRGWFQTSLLTGVATHDVAPFKQVLTHGYVVDGEGRKMSKSLGNVVSPADVIKHSGADILRLWVASSDCTSEINYSDEILTRSADAYRRIRNTMRFLLSNLFDFSHEKDAVPYADLVSLDRWVVDETAQLQDRIISAYEDYTFTRIYQFIHNFCTVTLGGFYLDVLKDRLYTAKSDGAARRSAQTALWHIAEALVRWLAPILSFTADEVWQHLPGEREDSVLLATWYTGLPEPKLTSKAISDAQKIKWSSVMQVRDAVNKCLETQRQAGTIGSPLDASVIVYADGDHYEALSALGNELRFVLITSEAKVAPLSDQTPEAEKTEVDGIFVFVQVSEFEKCERCWQRVQDVGADATHKTLCGRCVINVSGQGEARQFA